MKELKRLFDNNRKWASAKTEEDPAFFKRLAQKQLPLYLWIGCSDSRVPATEIVGLQPGELFVHRNVANLFPHTDFNSLSVLEFAVNILKVQHVIVSGHYGCGGVKAAMEDNQLGLVDNWLRHIRDIYALHRNELDAIDDPIERHNRLVERSVFQQVLNICHTTIVQRAWDNKQPLCVHGWVYDIHSGLLQDMDCCFSSKNQLATIYQTQR